MYMYSVPFLASTHTMMMIPL